MNLSELKKEEIKDKNTNNKPSFIDKLTKNQNLKKILFIKIVIVIILIPIFLFLTSQKINNNLIFNNEEKKSEEITSTQHLLSPTPTPTPIPKKYYNPINGEEIPEERFLQIQNRPVLAVIVQNHVESRPQAGINEADLVYETLVESGITRFMFIYWQNDTNRIQSIRSVRKYFIELLGEYNNPVLMHIGYATGSSDVNAIDAMNRYQVRRLSDLTDKETREYSFTRDIECQRIKAMEHCAWSDTARLWRIASQYGFTSDINQLQTWIFAEERHNNVNNNSIEKESIEINFSGTKDDYSSVWRYNKEDGFYYRVDPRSGNNYTDYNGQPVKTKTLIVQGIKSYYNGDSKGRIVQEVIGKGDGYILENGKITKVIWQKDSYNSKTRYFFAENPSQEYIFERGKKWIILVPNTSLLTLYNQYF
ncbi:MAG: DUF3048 domain-containing protein [Candidatus Dojkabacteria bacterium]|nr:DUF3048 domain-containing protein [Candidatus Dojkabacteria bacterium]